MTDGLFAEPDDATPLSPEERRGLLATHIALRGELNELEQQNILTAMTWAWSSPQRDPTQEDFGQRLHKRMFGKVWRWAGDYRDSDKNIGAPFRQVPIDMRQVYDNVRAWIEYGSYDPDELAVRFHHALVFVHPFPNGNGRWSRFMSDLLIVRLGGKAFTWGKSDLRSAGEVRAAYIAALKAADHHDFAALLAFARS